MFPRGRQTTLKLASSIAQLRATHTMSDSSIPYTLPLPGGIPDTHRPHTERTTTILVPKENTAFLNPVQEYNRDLSVSVIRAWNNQRKAELEARWRQKMEKEAKKRAAKAAKGGKVPEGESASVEVKTEAAEENGTEAYGNGEAEGEAGPSEVSIRTRWRLTLAAAQVPRTQVHHPRGAVCHWSPINPLR